jgi:CheY-like chemotaxis protein
MNSPRVLVVDDNEDVTRSLSLLLRANGYEVATAHDASQAMALAVSFNPQAVLLDIGLPDRDGWEVARDIRRLTGGTDLKLIAISGWATAEDVARSRAAGFDHHLCKPVGFAKLAELLHPSGLAQAERRAGRAVV